jgi:hypothetical protein
MNPAYTLRQGTDADFLFMRETKFEGMQPYITAVWGWNQQQQEELFAQGYDAARSKIIVSMAPTRDSSP